MFGWLPPSALEILIRCCGYLGKNLFSINQFDEKRGETFLDSSDLQNRIQSDPVASLLLPMAGRAEMQSYFIDYPEGKLRCVKATRGAIDPTRKIAYPRAPQ